MFGDQKVSICGHVMPFGRTTEAFSGGGVANQLARVWTVSWTVVMGTMWS